jgi:hypothetical protein
VEEEEEVVVVVEVGRGAAMRHTFFQLQHITNFQSNANFIVEYSTHLPCAVSNATLEQRA